jgi:hypothetical protein
MLLFWMFLAATSGIGAQPRLMLVGAPIAAILGALGLRSIAQLPRRPLDVYFILQAIIIFALLLGLFDVVHKFADTRVLDFMTGTIDKDHYVQQNLGLNYPALRHLETLPEGSVVQLMWEPKSYYCPDTIICIPDVLYDNWSHPIRTGTNPDDLMQQWRDEGIDYLLVYGLHTEYGEGYDFWLQAHQSAYDANILFPDLLEKYMMPIWNDGYLYTLYTWKD